jgi:hypothetical protein
LSSSSPERSSSAARRSGRSAISQPSAALTLPARGWCCGDHFRSPDALAAPPFACSKSPWSPPSNSPFATLPPAGTLPLPRPSKEEPDAPKGGCPLPLYGDAPASLAATTSSGTCAFSHRADDLWPSSQAGTAERKPASAKDVSSRAHLLRNGHLPPPDT